VQACALVWAPRASAPYPCLDEVPPEPKVNGSSTSMELATELPWYMMVDAGGEVQRKRLFKAYRGHTWGYEPPAKERM
jgi:hypothetical protein